MKKEIPDFLYQMLMEQYSKDDVERIIRGYSQKRVTTLRMNSSKIDIDIIKNVLRQQNITFCEVPWYHDALIINNVDEKEIKQLDIYDQGQIYLQSLSSMLPPIILNPKPNESILDMAAAPGGKTTQMANLSSHQARITACEKNPIRAQRLKYNLEKQGAHRVTILMQDARNLDDLFSFHKILLDAPCSGSGTLSITQDLKRIFTQELVNRSINKQRNLIRKAIQILKVNGELVYSTCSILKEENEEIVREILKNPEMELIPIDLSAFKGIPLLPTTLLGTICVCPNELYEGFFIAKMKKKQCHNIKM